MWCTWTRHARDCSDAICKRSFSSLQRHASSCSITQPCQVRLVRSNAQFLHRPVIKGDPAFVQVQQLCANSHFGMCVKAGMISTSHLRWKIPPPRPHFHAHAAILLALSDTARQSALSASLSWRCSPRVHAHAGQLDTLHFATRCNIQQRLVVSAVTPAFIQAAPQATVESETSNRTLHGQQVAGQSEQLVAVTTETAQKRWIHDDDVAPHMSAILTATAMGHEYSLDGSKPSSTRSATPCRRDVVSLHKAFFRCAQQQVHSHQDLAGSAGSPQTIAATSAHALPKMLTCCLPAVFRTCGSRRSPLGSSAKQRPSRDSTRMRTRA
jgi:hypothetical protein